MEKIPIKPLQEAAEFDCAAEILAPKAGRLLLFLTLRAEAFQILFCAGALPAEWSVFMKKNGFIGISEKRKVFFKKYGFYIALFVLSFAIGLTSYYSAKRDVAEEQAPFVVEDTATPAPATAAPRLFEPVKTAAPGRTGLPAVSATPRPEKEVSETVLAFIRPVQGEISVPFSTGALLYSKSMGDWRTHDGIDFKAEEGESVSAAAGGTVEKVYEDNFYGLTIIIDHGGGLKSIYSGLSSVNDVTKAGQKVKQGQRIGAVGNSAVVEAADGAHLHFAAERGGVRVDPSELIDDLL